MKSFKQHITELFDEPYKWRGGGMVAWGGGCRGGSWERGTCGGGAWGPGTQVGPPAAGPPSHTPLELLSGPPSPGLGPDPIFSPAAATRLYFRPGCSSRGANERQRTSADLS